MTKRRLFLIFMALAFSVAQLPAQEGRFYLTAKAQGSTGKDAAAHAKSSVRQEVVTLKAADGGTSSGVLYMPADKVPETALLNMHTTGEARNFLLMPLAQAGYAVLGQNNRYVNNETEGILEKMVLDIAAGFNFLKSRGVKKVVLLGMSAGGALMSFYQAQAETAPPGRVRSTPAGDPPDLNQFDLPAADGLLTVIPIPGSGKILEVRLDPSVITEGDPLSIDPSLDMYNPANGFRTAPEATTYSKEFITRYHAGQKARMERLDRWARSLIAQQEDNRRLMERSEYKSLPAQQRQWIERNANTERKMTVYRTAADLRYTDLAIDPSDRIVGDNPGTTPWVSNYALPSSPGYISPRAFLSVRSSISSNGQTTLNIAKVKVPTLIVQGTAHRAIYPNDTKAIFEAAGARDKKLVWIEGATASFTPSGPKSGKGDQAEQCTKAVVTWMQERFAH